MDVAQLRQRSASHASLHSAYRTHGRSANYTNPRPPPQRRPLRSVNENAALLRSPGPLESMLKTTTETGDIGIFSINPPSASSTYHQPTRPRQHYGDPSLLPLPRSRGYEDGYFQDDHKRLRSYRDTTSEIISLYGSDSQQTMWTSVSPSPDDGPRSYSMTTTSSKHIPSQQSSGTLQSQSSGSGGFQRPRSPFPYPTRLKRPGVRPASPALAENGNVDYSRMVELDRFSQRTVHGSYKPTYAHGPRRPPPLSLRADANRSTTSLPCRASPSPYYFGAGPCRARTPSSTVSWTSRMSDRHLRGSDNSTRSASLTSIVEMYNRPITGNANCPPLRSTGSFYYDYTEEFENQPPRDIALDIPLCPIPQRAGSIRRPMVLMTETLDAAENESDSAKSNSADAGKGEQPCSKIGANLNTKRKLDEKDSALSVEDALAILQSPTPNSQTDPENAQELPPLRPIPMVHDGGGRPVSPVSMNHELDKAASELPLHTAGIVQGKTSPVHGAWRLSKALGAKSETVGSSQSRRSSQSSLSKLRCTLDPAVSDFASILSSFDRLGTSPFSKAGGDVRSASEECHESSRYNDDRNDPDGPKQLSRRPSLPLFDQVNLENKAYRKCHRRNIAALRISTTGVSSEESSKETHGSQKHLPILSPKPISPVRQLRVKESIPQLMKALPPLPGEAETPPRECTVRMMSSSDRPDGDVLHLGKECHGERRNRLDIKPLPSPIETSQAAQESPPKLRIRVKAWPSGMADNVMPSPNNDRREHNVIQEPGSSPATRPKLKLKVSRSQLGQGRCGQNGPVMHNNRLKQCNSLAELAPSPRQHVSAARYKLGEGIEGRGPRTNTKMEEDENSRPEPSPQPSDQFNIPYPPSPDKAEAMLRPGASTNKVTWSEMRSVNSDVGASGSRGLRGKLSMLRLRLVGSQTATPLKKDRPAPPSVAQASSTPPSITRNEVNASRDMPANTKSRAPSTQSDKTGWRVKRWARDAKKAVRTYVRRTLDRSSRVTE